MLRTMLFLAGGVVLGLIIHLVVILTLPTLANNSVYNSVTAFGPVNQTMRLSKVVSGAANPLRLDPELGYAICRLDLSKEPGLVSGALPQGFWSVAVYDHSGTVIYSTTNRDGTGQTLDLGVFNPAQTRLLAEQQLDVADGLLIVESQTDDIFVVVRLGAAQAAMRDRYDAQLGQLSCGNIKS